MQCLRGLLALIALLNAGQVLAQETPALDWYRIQFPPFFILSGEAHDQGSNDRLLRALAAKLPQYRHRWVDAPLERVLERTGTADGLTCTGGLLRTPERETRMHFSNAYLAVPPNGAVIRASDAARFEPFLDAGRLSLARVLQTGKFVLGIQRGRSYGSGINPLLARHAGQSYLIEKPEQGANAALLSDLAAQRGVDLVLAYPLEAAYWLKTSRSPTRLNLLPIAEAVDYEQWRIACSRTPQGEQIITAINGLLADPGLRQEYLRAYLDWQARLASLLPGADLPPRLPDPAP